MGNLYLFVDYISFKSSQIVQQLQQAEISRTFNKEANLMEGCHEILCPFQQYFIDIRTMAG